MRSPKITALPTAPIDSRNRSCPRVPVPIAPYAAVRIASAAASFPHNYQMDEYGGSDGGMPGDDHGDTPPQAGYDSHDEVDCKEFTVSPPPPHSS